MTIDTHIGERLFLFNYSLIMISQTNSIGWYLDKKLKWNTITEQQILAKYPIRIDRDYHGCGIYNSMTLFAFVNNLDDYLKLCHSISNIEFHTEEQNNILHETIKNPNEICLYTILDLLPDRICYKLANEYNNHKCKPIEYTASGTAFSALAKYTEFTGDILFNCMKHSFEIQRIINESFNISNTSENHLNPNYY